MEGEIDDDGCLEEERADGSKRVKAMTNSWWVRLGRLKGKMVCGQVKTKCKGTMNGQAILWADARKRGDVNIYT